MRVLPFAAAAMLCAGIAHADPFQGVPNPQYPDGTGNDEVDRLNAGQLNAPPPPPYYGPTSYPAAPSPYEPPPGMPPGREGAPLSPNG